MFRVAFVLTQWFHLPLTPYLLPGNIIGAVIIVSNKWTISKALQWHSESILPAFVACASIILPTILATCAGIYGLDNDIVSGQIESSWTRLFRSKDESTIHGIQSSLHCCGLHSTKDRAAPFPDKDTDAHACERESGYLIPCAPAWQRHLTIAASLHLVASVMLSIAAVRITLYILVVLLLTSYLAFDDSTLRFLEKERLCA